MSRPVRTAALQHVWLVCNCNRTACMFCDGGLSACTVCGGFEGSLPTHCPGAEMGQFTEQKVYTTDLDFVNGAWVRNPRKGGLTGAFDEVRKRHERDDQVFYIRAICDAVDRMPSMEREKMRRGW